MEMVLQLFREMGVSATDERSALSDGALGAVVW